MKYYRFCITVSNIIDATIIHAYFIRDEIHNIEFDEILNKKNASVSHVFSY